LPEEYLLKNATIKGEAMRKSDQSPVLREIRTLFGVGTNAGLSDGELLERFVGREEEAAQFAFAALVERHGPMVFRICNRLLADAHESQDAFQATFLILVRKARSLKDRGSVGPWLFGVARRVAARTRTATARRAYHERRYVEGRENPESADDHERSDLEAILHEEVSRLPDRYRSPIVLCYLEGVTQEEAATRLGWPIGTVRSRLSRARERLRGRLTRRGVVLSAGALLGALAGDVSAAPRLLVGSTVKAATQFAAGQAAAEVASASVLALTQGVLRSFFMTKLKSAMLVVIVLGASATGAGVFAFHPVASVEPERGAQIQDGARITPDEVRHPNEAEMKERLHKAIDRASREQLVHAALQIGSGEQLLRALSREGEASEREEAELKKRLHKALDEASKEQLVKAALQMGSAEKLLRALTATHEAGPRREAEFKERLHKALDKSSKEDLVKLILGKESREEMLRALAGEHGGTEREEAEMKERLHKALDKASKEQLVHAALQMGPQEQLLRILESQEEPKQRQVKEKVPRD
jgi:RNA polymerase sigma-70 factor (ECF subfamily)